jgi:hypothetical protein
MVLTNPHLTYPKSLDLRHPVNRNRTALNLSYGITCYILLLE